MFIDGKALTPKQAERLLELVWFREKQLASEAINEVTHEQLERLKQYEDQQQCHNNS